MDPSSCIDQCFIADSMLEELPAPSEVGKTKHPQLFFQDFEEGPKSPAN